MTRPDELTHYAYLEGALQNVDPQVAASFFEAAAAIVHYSHRRMELKHELDKINKDFEAFYESQCKAADDRKSQKANLEKMLMRLIDFSGQFPEQPQFLQAALTAFEKFVDGAPDYQQKAIAFLRDRYEYNR